MNKLLLCSLVLAVVMVAIIAASGCAQLVPAPTQTPKQTIPVPSPVAPTPLTSSESKLLYVVVDTVQNKCYDNSKEVAAPRKGQPFYGQDFQYQGNQPAYKDNGDGTVTDSNTGLMWQKSPDSNGDGIINFSDKLYYEEAVS